MVCSTGHQAIFFDEYIERKEEKNTEEETADLRRYWKCINQSQCMS